MAAATINLEVQQPYFDAIKSGTKTIEGRLAKQKYTTLKAGDTIQFMNPSGGASITKKVARVYRYPTFEDAFEHLSYKNAIPNAESSEQAIKIYEQFYPRPIQDELGVVFIVLQK